MWIFKKLTGDLTIKHPIGGTPHHSAMQTPLWIKCELNQVILVLRTQHCSLPRQASLRCLWTFKLFTLSGHLIPCHMSIIVEFHMLQYYLKYHLQTSIYLQPSQDQYMPHSFITIPFLDFHLLKPLLDYSTISQYHIHFSGRICQQKDSP